MFRLLDDGGRTISIVTQRVVGEGAAVSTLTLVNPSAPGDSGKYSCRPENLEPAHVSLHVIRGTGTKPFVKLIFIYCIINI
jgi:hypothetical protein